MSDTFREIVHSLAVHVEASISIIENTILLVPVFRHTFEGRLIQNSNGRNFYIHINSCCPTAGKELYKYFNRRARTSTKETAPIREHVFGFHVQQN